MADFARDEFRASRGDKLMLKVRVLRTGDWERNLHLARDRASAVRYALVRRGIPRSSILVVGRKTDDAYEAQVIEVDLIEGSTCG